MIWKNQNPADCRKAKYLITEFFHSGFGSEHHVNTVVLGIALEENRVLLLKDDLGHLRYENKFCSDQNARSMDCYFLPWSKCTLEDAYYAQQYAITSSDVIELPKFPVQKKTAAWKTEEDNALLSLVILAGTNRNWQHISNTLNISKTPLQCWQRWKELFDLNLKQQTPSEGILKLHQYKEEIADIEVPIISSSSSKHPTTEFYVMTTFRYSYRLFEEEKLSEFVLPNFTHSAIEKFHFPTDQVLVMELATTLSYRRYIPSKLTRFIQCTTLPVPYYYLWWRSIAATFFLRPNKTVLKWLEQNRDVTLLEKTKGKCISTYVRHGDKASEMTLVPFSMYAEQAVKVWQERTDILKVFYLSTEDPLVFREAISWAKNHSIELRYSSILEKTMKQLESGHVQRDYAHEYLSYLLTLVDNLACEVNICTLASNYCRLIDELRSTVGGKGNKLFVDLTKETCRSPPCYNYCGMGNHIGEIYEDRESYWR